MNQSISAVILTKNEENNIERCVASLGWCDEIVIIDDFSEDGTIEKVQSLLRSNSGQAKFKVQNQNLKLKVYKRHLEENFAQQRNFGLEKASGDWILFVDADEVITKELEEEIKWKVLCHSGDPAKTETPESTKESFWTSQNDDKKVTGFYINRKDYFGGKWLKYGETANVKLLRFGRRGTGKWDGRVHEVWKVEGILAEFKNPILHYPHPTVSEFLRDVNWYTDIVVQCWKEEGRKMGFWEILVYPKMKFILNYLLRLGFLDGAQGFIMAIFMSFHSFLARSKYWLKFKKS